MDRICSLAREVSCNTLQGVEKEVARSGKNAKWIHLAVRPEKLTLSFYGHKGRCYKERAAAEKLTHKRKLEGVRHG
jgi:hypothetical protein